MIVNLAEQLRSGPHRFLGVFHLSGADHCREVGAYEDALGVGRIGRAIVAVPIAGRCRSRSGLLGRRARAVFQGRRFDVRVLSVGDLDIVGLSDLEESELLAKTAELCAIAADDVAAVLSFGRPPDLGDRECDLCHRSISLDASFTTRPTWRRAGRCSWSARAVSPMFWGS